MKVVVLFVLLAACSTPKIFVRQPLFEQRLAPRPGFVGLTNQVCELKEDNKCTKWSVAVYDLKDPIVRQELIRLKFVCNVSGMRYRISPDRNGLSSWHDCGFWCKYVEVSYLDMEKDHQKLLNSNTVCASQDSDFGKFLFLR
jgi:hypothetical protein